MRKNRFSSTDSQKGFSLIEIAVVLAIIAILAAVAIPGFSTFLPKHRLKSATQDLYSALQEAKIAAVENNSTSTVTINASGYIKADGTQVILSEQYEGSVIFGRSNAGSVVEGLTGNNVIFNDRGMADSPVAEGRIYFKNSKSDDSYCVVILTSGVMTIERWNGSSYE